MHDLAVNLDGNVGADGKHNGGQAGKQCDANEQDPVLPAAERQPGQGESKTPARKLGQGAELSAGGVIGRAVLRHSVNFLDQAGVKSESGQAYHGRPRNFMPARRLARSHKGFLLSGY